MTKYHAKPTTVDGIRFASKREANRYSELKLLERAGEISRLELQPEYPIVIANVLVTTYRADFQYIDKRGVFHLEDVKGVRTPVYRLKKKLVHACYGFPIEEV